VKSWFIRKRFLSLAADSGKATASPFLTVRKETSLCSVRAQSTSDNELKREVKSSGLVGNEYLHLWKAKNFLGTYLELIEKNGFKTFLPRAEKL
jgi:hypothetical protein